MCFNKIIRFVIFSFLINDFAFSQETLVKKDSTLLYEKIETYSRKNKFNDLVLGLVFKPVSKGLKTEDLKKSSQKKLITNPNAVFEGKIIRNIEIVTLDPFGYSVTDTNATSNNFFLLAGNWLHINTRKLTIRNLLLFHKNQPFNSLIVKESERLIRIQKYVHDVSFSVVAAGINSDSVDISIRELDNWSITPAGTLSSSRIKIGLTDKNFLGMGHEFRNTFSEKYIDGIGVFNTYYSIPNFRNTYISALLHFGIDANGSFDKILAIDRPFYSPLTKWAAGVSFVSVNRDDSLKDINLLYEPINLEYKTQDYWAGYAKQILKDRSSDESVTNLIFAMRYLNIRYFEKPSEIIDPLNIYENERLYLAAIGVSSRKYVRDKYLYKYGVFEDVPVGKVYELTGGYQVRNNTGRMYLGARYSYGTYYRWGYLSTNIEYGSFFRNSDSEQSVLTAGLNYFTKLFEIGRWKFRQFVRPQIDIGIRRVTYDSITLNDGYGLDGFNSPALSGTSRLLVTLQTQLYAPWNLIGFRFGPYLVCSLGMLGNAITEFKNSKVYSQIGLGVLIKNENLVFNRFQISISFYPIIPGIGYDVFKMNAFKTTDFGFRDFEMEKPATMIYQ